MTTATEAGRRVALDEIRVPENVRTLDDAHVQALAGSIKLQGILVPLVVRSDDTGSASIASRLRARSAWPTCRSSCAMRRPRTPIAPWRTSRHADIGMM